MEFLASSDARIEQLRGERTATLDQGRYLLGAALGTWHPETLAERNPVEDQLIDINAELARRREIADTTALPQRGNPDFDGKTDAELEHELGELTISAGLSQPGSAVHAAAKNRIRAIDQELARRAGKQTS